MRLSFAATVVAALALVASVTADTCARIQQRREFRTLTHTERMTFINGVRSLQSQSPRPNRYDRYVQRHVEVDTFAHGNARFLSWHRSYLRALEKDLQAINPSITIPYWDWAYDSQAPHTSIIFSANYFGGNGDPNNNYCVMNGQFNRNVWQPLTQKRCIARRFDGPNNRLEPLWSWDALNAYVMTETTYDGFRSKFELTHGNVHNGIGDMFMTMRSPDDAIFWLHHSFVDKVWNDWQLRRIANFRAYGGRNSDGRNAVATDSIDYGYTVNDVFDTRNLCYTYANFDGTIPPIITPPTTTPPPTTTTRTSSTSTSTTSSSSSSSSSSGTSTRTSSSSSSSGTRTTTSGTATPTGTATATTTTTGSYKPTPTVVPPYTNGTVPTNGTYVNVTVPGVIVKPGNNTNPDDKYREPGNVINICPPPPIPEAWCRMNHRDVNEARRYENDAKKIIYQLNNLPGYVSKCALINNPEALEKLAREGVKFTGYIGNRKIEIPYDSANPTDAVKQVQYKTAEVVKQVYKQVHFVYPKVIENIYRQIDVYNGGRTSLPTLPTLPIIGGEKPSGDDKYDEEEDCEDDEDDKYDEEEDCEEDGELPADDEDCEEEEDAKYDEEEDCEEEGEKPAEEEDCEEEEAKYEEEEDCEEDAGEKPTTDYKPVTPPKPAY